MTYTTGKGYGIFWQHKGNTRIWHFNLLEMAWHQPQTSIVILMQIVCVMLWEKNAMRAMSEIQDTQQTVHECIISFILRLKFPTTSTVSIIALYIRYWHHGKFTTVRWMTIWEDNCTSQTDRRTNWFWYMVYSTPTHFQLRWAGV